MTLQDKIERLHKQAYDLLHIECSGNYLYADNLSRLNQEIHDQINELFSQHGYTVEQEAALCLALLMGYSVILYANPDDDFKREAILVRSQKILETLSPSLLKEDLLLVCKEYMCI